MPRASVNAAANEKPGDFLDLSDRDARVLHHALQSFGRVHPLHMRPLHVVTVGSQIVDVPESSQRFGARFVVRHPLAR